MAHETAHVCAHHAAREMTRLNYAQLSMIPVMIFVPGWTGYGIYEASSIAIARDLHEVLTRLRGTGRLPRRAIHVPAGYDPQAFITFFEKVQALEKRKPRGRQGLADHPQTPERILASQERCRILPARDEYTVTTSEFDDVKARWRASRTSAASPTQRTATNPRCAGQHWDRRPDQPVQHVDRRHSTSSSDDDKPTLHRRDDQN